jgi:outer membrane protein OmpA-like peptidoglycan-associated protein
MLLAAALAGCATSAQHRGSGQLSSEGQPAKPGTAAAASVSAEAGPRTFKDEGGGEAKEEPAAQPALFADEAAQQQDQAPGPQQFTDQAGPVPEEKPFAQPPFVDDQVAAKDDGGAEDQHFTDDAAALAKDEDSTAQQTFTDDAPAAKDDTSGAPQKFIDEAASAEDRPFTQQQFTDEAAAPANEEAAAPEVFKDDNSGTAPEELVHQPETFADDEKLAQAEEPKPAPATMLPMTITVEADPLFDFDQYAIRPESRRRLDDLVQQLKGVVYGEVITVGFADPIGTKMYNQALSQRRAASVEQYLLSRGIPADKIRIEARGATEQYASYQGCEGHGTRNLIECLQPDRRVEVTVTAGKQQ